MFSSRYNDDLWLKFETARVLLEEGAIPVIRVKEATEVRVGVWRMLVREAEKEASLAIAESHLRRFADAHLEALRAKEALADAIELGRRVEEWLSRLPEEGARDEILKIA